MKKLLVFTLSIIMLLSLSLPAYAAETISDPYSYTVTINEYDVYVATRTASASDLAKAGISTRHADLIKSNAIENELLELSALSADELKSLGYTKEQILLLHNYTGERIENAPELRGVFADMTATFSKVSASTTALTVKVEWNWSNAPALAGNAIVDMVAMRWQGTNTAGAPINVAFNSAGSSCSIKYYSRSGVYQYSRSASIVCNSPYDHAYAEIPMSTGDGDGTWQYYAKSGTLKVKVERTGTNIIQEAAFVFGYGHTTIVISPSLSLPASFGIGFSFGTETMVEKAIRMNSSGVITEY